MPSNDSALPLCRDPNNVETTPATCSSTRRRRFLITLVSTLTLLLACNVCTPRPAPSIIHMDQSNLGALDESSIRYLSIQSPSALTIDDFLLERLSPESNFQRLQAPPARAAACAQSLIGNGIYDVILLEFAPSEAAATAALLKRLQHRFPHSTVVSILVWTPSSLSYQGSMPFSEWKSIKSNNVVSTNANDWSLEVDVEQLDAVAALPRDNPADWDQWFTSDGSALSVQGQEELYNRVLAQLHSTPMATTELGDWGLGDACSLWYQKDDAPMTDRRMTEIAPQKYALEVPNKGSIVVQNPFDEERLLHLTYMTSDPSHKVYPKTRLSVGSKQTLVLDPVRPHELEEEDGHKRRPHYTRTTAVGFVPPGETVIQLESIEWTSNRFRLVGVSLLGVDAKEVPVEFDLAPEPANHVRTSRFAF